MTKPVIAITMGDPCGVGPEIIAMALANPEIESLCRPLVLGDQAAMERALAVTRLPLRLEILPEGVPPKSTKGAIYLRPLSRLAPTDMEYGGPSSDAGDAMYRYIKEAVSLCLSGEAAAMANAPISKEAMNRAGHYYPGHTELVAELTGCTDYVMMLAGDRLRVTLVTIHEAISNVPRLITFDKVLSTIRTTHRSLHTYFRKNPRLAVLALNPHCGEKGLFGDEERRFIAPASRGGPGRRNRCPRPPFRRHALLFRCTGRVRRRCLHVPRPGPYPLETAPFSRWRQRHAGTAHHPHLRGSRHCLRPGRNRTRLVPQHGCRDQDGGRNGENGQ